MSQLATSSVWPGLALAFALAAVAKLIATVVPVSAVLIAIVLGVVWRSTLGEQARFLPGLEWVVHKLLRLGIALVGLRITLSGLATVGFSAVPVVLISILCIFGVSIILGRMLGISRPLMILLAMGTAVCGCTAIVATSATIRSKALETSVAVTCVVVIGSLGMLLYPWVAHELFANAPAAVGMFLATSIHDTSQVVGAALLYSQQFNQPEVIGIAGLTKLLRNLSLVFLIPLAAFLALQSSAALTEPGGPRPTLLPVFLRWFIALALCKIVLDLNLVQTEYFGSWQSFLGWVNSISEWLLVCAMAAIGHSLALSQLRMVGLKPLVFASALALTAALVSMTTIQIFVK
jgi:uncharacterized integral membrane protein (TIGR00698 family)